ncbi:hypothetical protein VTK26DRAFT_1549 [Humicola hyalothermophila]
MEASEPPLKKRRGDAEMGRGLSGGTRNASKQEQPAIVISDDEDTDDSGPGGSGVASSSQMADQPRTVSVPTGVTQQPPSELLDPFGRPLPDAAIAVARAYWDAQREIDCFAWMAPKAICLSSTYYSRPYIAGTTRGLYLVCLSSSRRRGLTSPFTLSRHPQATPFLNSQPQHQQPIQRRHLLMRRHPSHRTSLFSAPNRPKSWSLPPADATFSTPARQDVENPPSSMPSGSGC